MYEFNANACSECGMHTGHAWSCSCRSKSIMRTSDDNNQGGRDLLITKPVSLGCSECGQISGHTYSCSKNPIDLRSDYQKGFDDGERSAGSSGDNGFEYGGE